MLGGGGFLCWTLGLADFLFLNCYSVYIGSLGDLLEILIWWIEKYVRGAPGGKKGVISEAPLGRERLMSISVTSSRVIWLLELRSRSEKASRIERI